MGGPAVYAMFAVICVAGIARPFWGLAGYVFFLFLMPEWNWRYGGIPLDAGFQKYIAISTIVGLAFSGFKGNSITGWLGCTVVALLAFLGLAWISSFQTVSQALTDVYMDVISKSILMAIIAARVIDSPLKARLLLSAMILGSGFNALQINEDYLTTGYANWVNNNWGLKGDNNIYSLFTFPAICTCLVYLLNSKHFAYTAVYGILTLLHLHQVMLLESRGAMLGLSLSTSLILWLTPKTAHYWRIVTLGGVATVLLAGPPVVKEFTSIFADQTERDTSADSRFTLWAATSRVTADHALLGVGPGAAQVIIPKYAIEYANTSQKHPHNFFLEISSGCGVPALLAIVIFIAVPSIHAFRSLRRSLPPLDPEILNLRIILLAMIPGFCLSAMFAGSALIESLYIIILTCSGGIWSGEVDYTQPTPPERESRTIAHATYDF